MSIKKKDAEIQADKIVKRMIEKKENLSNLLTAIKAKDDSIRYPNAIALEILSEEYPEMIYPHWDFFAELLQSMNAYHKSIAISIISNLTTVDKQNKFEDIFEQFYKLLDDKSVIVSRKLAMYSGRIVKSKHSLRHKITTILLNINETQHNPSRKDLIKGDIIESFNEYFEDIKEKEKIIKFVRSQLGSSSPSTVKKAKKFLSKWEK